MVEHVEYSSEEPRMEAALRIQVTLDPAWGEDERTQGEAHQ
jgi:hypothetical protein